MLYGVEVKNQLGYIDQTDFQTKLQMCEFFGKSATLADLE